MGRTVKVFVSFSFESDSKSYEYGEFVQAVTKLFEQVERRLRKDDLDVKCVLIMTMDGYGQRLSSQIEQSLLSAHLGFLEISDYRHNVFYELGYLTARGIPRVAVRSRLHGKKKPADVDDRLVYEYSDSILGLPNDTVLIDRICRLCCDLLVRVDQEELERQLCRVWFGESPSQILLVTSSKPDSGTSAIDAHGDRVGDVEALKSARILLSQLYPKAKLLLCSSQDYERHFTHLEDSNLLVIGGPGGNDGGSHNSLCRRFMESLNLRVRYGSECQTMIVDEVVYSAKERYAGVLKTDWGCFVRLPNPLNPMNSIVIAHGIHSYGVTGAIRLFSRHPRAQSNLKKIIEHFDYKRELAFECFFEVDVVAASNTAEGIPVPNLDNENIILIQPPETVPTCMRVEGANMAPGDPDER